MIPPFGDDGFLPPGIHPATLDEIEARFGRETELRRVQMESIRWMVELAIKAGVQRIILNGSFVTDIMEPNDVDCVLLEEEDRAMDEAGLQELEQRLPFLDVSVVGPEGFDRFVNRFFAFDRHLLPKGMIEIIP